MNHKIEHEEMRFLRREMINQCLYSRVYGWHFSLSTIKYFVRLGEVQHYGSELQAYKDLQP